MKNEIIKKAIPSNIENPWYDIILQVISNSTIAFIEKKVGGKWINDRLDLEFKHENLKSNERASCYSFCEIYGFSRDNIAKRFARTAINNNWVLPKTIGDLIVNFLCWCDDLDKNRNSPSFITVYTKEND